MSTRHVAPPSVLVSSTAGPPVGDVPAASHRPCALHARATRFPVPGAITTGDQLTPPSVVRTAYARTLGSCATPGLGPIATQVLADEHATDRSTPVPPATVRWLHVWPASLLTTMEAPTATQNVAVGHATDPSAPAPAGNVDAVHVEPPSLEVTTWPWNGPEAPGDTPTLTHWPLLRATHAEQRGVGRRNRGRCPSRSAVGRRRSRSTPHRHTELARCTRHPVEVGQSRLHGARTPRRPTRLSCAGHSLQRIPRTDGYALRRARTGHRVESSTGTVRAARNEDAGRVYLVVRNDPRPRRRCPRRSIRRLANRGRRPVVQDDYGARRRAHRDHERCNQSHDRKPRSAVPRTGHGLSASSRPTSASLRHEHP